TNWPGAVARPEYSNSLVPRGASMDEIFICCFNRSPTALTVKTPVSSIKLTLSFLPEDENITRGGVSAIMLKKEYGARFTQPLRDLVPIQPMGRGAMIAFNGLCGNPCPLPIS